MEQIVIIRTDGTLLPLTLKGQTSAVTKAEQRISLLGEDVVNIGVKTAGPIEFYIGDRINIYGKTYTLNQLPTIKKVGTRNFEYSLTFEGVQYELIDAQWLLPVETVLDSFTGDLDDFVNILIDNANRVFPGTWVKGMTPANTETKTLTYTENNCLEVLQKVCEVYETEFEITQSNGIRTINIKKAGVTFPYTFSYGRTGGLYELTRQNVNAKNVVTRLYVYGGSNNLGSKYRYSKLCLPLKEKNASYIENTAAIEAFGIKENTKVFDKVFPKRIGEVTAGGSKYYSFIDNTMNFDLNEKEEDGETTKWLINGVAGKIKVTSGSLAGYEFEIHKYINETKEIQLVPFTDENGMKFPSETSAAFQFKVGDKYIFTDINLPDSYKTEAENKLQVEAEEYYSQYSQPQVQYGLSIDQNFIKQFAGELTIVNLFAVGDYIQVEDADIGLDKSIRITAFTRDLLQPYKYNLTLGDSVKQSLITRVISDLQKIDEVIKINNLSDPAQARRNWRSSQEVLASVFDTEGNYFSEKIKPLSIETSMLAVGAKSMQFILQNTLIEANYEGNKNAVKVTGGTLAHYTIAEEIRTWSLASATTTLTSDSQAYYIYGRCQKNGTAGSIIFSSSQIKVNEDPLNYHFWIGVLNSVDDDVRAISLTYGATTVNGRYIKTGRIESGDGKTYFDLDTEEIGGNINFKDGLVSGEVGIGNENGVNAGMNGKETDGESVRIWAGATSSNKANAPFRVLDNGKVVMENAEVQGTVKSNKGVLSNVLIDGSITTPFRGGNFKLTEDGPISVSTYGLQNNNCVVIPGTGGGWITAFAIPFSPEYNGFRATIINTKWGGVDSNGPISANAQPGLYFHENGETLSSLRINANEGIDMIGVGEGNSFKGWLILKRFHFGVDKVGEGFNLKAVFAGKVELKNGYPSLIRQKRFNQYFPGEENKKLTLSYQQTAPRYSTINIPAGTFTSADNYTVLLTGEALRTDNGPGAYASIIKRSATSFTIYTGDDETWNDANFTFIVLATHLWEN